jgi:hypothetical protein
MALNHRTRVNHQPRRDVIAQARRERAMALNTKFSLDPHVRDQLRALVRSVGLAPAARIFKLDPATVNSAMAGAALQQRTRDAILASTWINPNPPNEAA